MSEKVPFLKSFYRSQITALAATIVDFSTLYLLQQSGTYSKLFGISNEKGLLFSTATASLFGAIVSFLLNRYWAFEKADKNIYGQAIKYAVASFIIALVNVAGMELLANQWGYPYMWSKVIIAAITGVVVSFPLFRYWVYK